MPRARRFLVARKPLSLRGKHSRNTDSRPVGASAAWAPRRPRLESAPAVCWAGRAVDILSRKGPRLDSAPRTAWNTKNTSAVIVLLFAALNLVVFLIRAVSVHRFGALFATSGGEGQVIYSIWKYMRHLPVYEFPLKWPFGLSLYNYLFYDSYAVILKWIGVSDAGIKTTGRLLTAVFPILGAIAQWLLVRYHLHLRGAQSLLSLAFALGLWFCTSLVRWWALTLRPDMAAVALVMIALCLVARKPRFGFAAAGVVFYLAWAFKQSIVLTFVTVCVFLLFQRRWRGLLPMAGVFAVLVAVTLAVQSPEYRFNVLVSPRLVTGGYSLAHALHVGGFSLISNVYWIAPAAMIWLTRGKGKLDELRGLLFAVFAFSLLAGFAAMSKSGASDNYLLEAFVAGSTLLQILFFERPGFVVPALVMVGCMQPAGQLAFLRSGRHTLGVVSLATAAEYQSALAVKDALDRLPKPIFSIDDSFNPPWISTDDKYPAMVVDLDSYVAVHTRCENGGVEGMLLRGELPTAVLSANETLFHQNLNPAYARVGSFVHQGVPYEIYTLRR